MGYCGFTILAPTAAGTEMLITLIFLLLQGRFAWSEGVCAKVPTLKETDDTGWNNARAFNVITAYLKTLAKPKVLVMGAANSRGGLIAGPEDPSNPLWRDIPNIEVVGTDFKGANLTKGSEINFKFVKVFADAHTLSKDVGEEKYDAILSIAVFEHLRYPWLAAAEIVR